MRRLQRPTHHQSSCTEFNWGYEGQDHAVDGTALLCVFYTYGLSRVALFLLCMHLVALIRYRIQHAIYTRAAQSMSSMYIAQGLPLSGRAGYCNELEPTTLQHALYQMQSPKWTYQTRCKGKGRVLVLVRLTVVKHGREGLPQNHVTR